MTYQPPTRLVGVWKLHPDTRTVAATRRLPEALAELCAEHGVTTTGRFSHALFTGRQDVTAVGLRLNVPATALERLAEIHGFGPQTVFIAAAVDVCEPFSLVA